MSAKHAATQGACLCGAVRYEVDGPFSMLIHCHCSMCRKHHGSSFGTFAAAPLMGFRWLAGADQVVTYASSEKGQRSFCRGCGSVVPLPIKEMDLAICPAGNLQGDLQIRPSSHFFAASKAPWYTITDNLPQHEEYPEEFGTTGVTRPQVEPREGIVDGSCLCGDVRFEIVGPALRMLHCHCSRCRRGRSAAHATNAVYKLGDVRFTHGANGVGYYKVPDAKHFTVAFCRRCGSGVPHDSPGRGITIVPAGSLDTDPGVRPQCHIFVDSKADWFDITDSLPQHPAGLT